MGIDYLQTEKNKKIKKYFRFPIIFNFFWTIGQWNKGQKGVCGYIVLFILHYFDSAFALWMKQRTNFVAACNSQ
jgi:hypothetical protein